MRPGRRVLRLTKDEVRGVPIVDVRFDGHRVWSVSTSTTDSRGNVVLTWPRALRSRLTGRTRVSVADAATGDVLAERDARFDLSRKRLAIIDKRGQWLAMTKWDRLGPVIEGSADDVASRLLASGAKLVEDMHAWGYPLYLVGGVLLGMVRGGELLPHDDDIDFAFLSDAQDPAELGLISFEMERRLTEAGYTVARHSLAHIELVFFDEAGEVDHYIDIFTGFFHEGQYCQPFALRGDQVKREDLVPTKDILVNGVPLPAPANPEAWLAYAYGEGWRVPDPTFKFVVPRGTKRRFDSWFGIFNRGRFFWEKHWQGVDEATGSAGGAATVEAFDALLNGPSHVLDLGCGDGHWGQGLAARGHEVVGVDLSFGALRIAKENNEHGVALMRVNANDRAALLTLGADLLDTRQRWHIVCNDVLHGLTFTNRENVYLLLRMVLRRGSVALLTFDTERSPHYLRADPRTWHYPLEKFLDEISESGLVVDRIRTGTRRSEIGRRRYASVVIRAGGTRTQARTWQSERPENVA